MTQSVRPAGRDFRTHARVYALRHATRSDPIARAGTRGRILRDCAAVALPLDKIGKTYEPVLYAVGREKIREYAEAVGETNPLHHDLQAARAAGHADLVAPPMFVVVYASRAFMPALFDPELEIDFSMLVHGAQEFRWRGRWSSPVTRSPRPCACRTSAAARTSASTSLSLSPSTSAVSA